MMINDVRVFIIIIIELVVCKRLVLKFSLCSLLTHHTTFS